VEGGRAAALLRIDVWIRHLLPDLLG
jgi:hypothetical protein